MHPMVDTSLTGNGQKEFEQSFGIGGLTIVRIVPEP